MQKSLISKVAPWVFTGLSLIGGGCAKTYDIDGSKITDCRGKPLPITLAIMKEEKDSCTIRYFTNLGEVKKIKVRSVIKIFSPMNNTYKLSNPEDSIVMRYGEGRFNYLTNKIDSIKKLNENEERQERINLGLKALE